MANNLVDISTYINNMYGGDVWPVPVQIKRGNGLPLDQSTIFQTLSDAQSYAAGNQISTYAPNGKMLVQQAAYRGQYIAVVPLSGETSAYIVNSEGGLTQLATGGDATKELSVTVEKLATPESGYEATYVVKQGGSQVGDSINIPKDKVISAAYMVTVKGNYETGKTTKDDISSFTVTYAEEDHLAEKDSPTMSATYWSIWNAYTGEAGGDGSYLRITVTNAGATPIYVAVPKLVDTYEGLSSETIDVKITGNKGETRYISAFVNPGSIGTEQLKDGAVTTGKLDSSVTTWGESLSTNAYNQAATYTDTKVNGLDWDNNVEATSRIKSISQTDGKLSVEVETLTMANVGGDWHTAIKDSLSDDFDSKGSAATAITYANELCASLSTAVDAKIDAEETARNTAIENKGTILSAYAEEKATTAKTEAIASANAYTDEKITALSIGDTYETKVDAAAKLEEAKQYTDTLSTAVDTKISTARSDLSSYARETSANAYDQANAYTDAEIDTLSTALQGKIDAEATARQNADSAITTKVETLSGEVAAISGNHETRITTVETKVAKLSSAMHFKGVNLTVELSTGSTLIPVPPYKTGETAEPGDVVIVKNSQEFVWALSDSEDENSGQWYELGAEGIWATKTALEAETERAKADEQTISSALDNKIKVGNYGSTLSNSSQLSVIKISDEDYYSLVAEEKQNNDVVYIVSSDFVNGHGERIINVGTAISATDAVNLSGMNAAIEAAAAQIVANSLSGVELNGISATVTNNVAYLSVDIIDCGGAS